jgi:Tol biopolymer transport system component
MKKTVIIMVLALITVTSSYAKKKFAISVGNENLSALTQVTDREEPCITPFGGDYGENLFFAARENKKYFNIYMKENAFTASMSQKTSGKNNNYAPFYSKKLGKIVFRCQNDGMSTSDIFMMNANQGKTLSQITETSNAFENNPCLSPDGTILIYDKQSYTSYRSGTFWSAFLGLGDSYTLVESSEIWTKNLKTGENTLICNGYQPTFSPDGKKVAYVKYSGDAKSCSIWLMNIDGTDQTQLTDAKKGYAFHPHWSPDGKRIVFQSTKKDKKDADLYIINTDGDNLVQLTQNRSYDGSPYWTSDNYIYFVSDRGNFDGNYQIWRFKIEM